jgi:hypothetical protein
MKRFIHLLVFGAFALLAMNACERAYVDLGSTDKPLNGSSEPVFFQADIIPILSGNCTGCHGTGGQSPVLEASVAYDNLTGGGYINTAAPSSSPLYVKLTESGSSHINKCSDGDKDKILGWISQGALNN